MTCGCAGISISDLSTLIVIERYSSASDGQGGSTRTWVEDPSGGVWAKWEAVRDAFSFLAERGDADRLVSKSRFRATVRFKGDANGAPYWTAADRVSFRGRYYNIESAVDIDGRQEWIELSLVEGDVS